MADLDFNPYRACVAVSVPEFLLSRDEISPVAKLLYAKLARYHGNDGQAFPSVARLAQDVGCTKRSVFRCLAELRENKLIRIVRRDAQSLPSLYRFYQHPWMFARPGLLTAIGLAQVTPPDDYSVTPPRVTSAPAEGSDGCAHVTPPLGDSPRTNVRRIGTKRKHSEGQADGVLPYPDDVGGTPRMTSGARIAAEPGADPGSDAAPPLHRDATPPPPADTRPKQKTAHFATAALRAGARDVTPPVTELEQPPDENVTGPVTNLVPPSIQVNESVKRVRERSAAQAPPRSPPLVLRLQRSDSEAVREVLAVYDAAHVKATGRHYVASEEQDAAAASFAWQKAQAIAEQEAEEKSLPAEEVPALRTRVLQHWSRKLLTNRDYAASKGFAFWTIKSMVTQLGTPFQVGVCQRSRPGIAKPAAPAMSPAELGEGWASVLADCRAKRAFGDIGG